MSLTWIFVLVFLIVISYIAYRIFKKLVKTMITVIAVAIIASLIIGYVVKLDINQLPDKISEGAVYVFEDELAYETNPFSELEIGNTTILSEMIGNKTVAFKYNQTAIEAIDGDGLSLSGNYSSDVAAFREIVESENETLFLMQQIKEGNIEMYPGSAVAMCADKCPSFMIKILAK